ncbi:MAG: hypothetical protein RL375_4763 [Pseudomonadota bacterium]|jgi:hypothetical protein
MPLFWKAHTSDVTDFIATLKQKDPQLTQRQLEGRALLWDRQIDLADQAEFKAAKVAQQPYVYQTKSD